jgi:hypothetical protein
MQDIGVRAAKEVYNRIDSEHDIHDVLLEIDVTLTAVWQWRKRRHVPGGKVLRKMALAGYDVHYILTGERKKL